MTRSRPGTPFLGPSTANFRLELTPEVLLNAYCSGIFPMADDRDGPIHWYAPDPRAIIPLDSFRVSRNLRRSVEKRIFDVRFDSSFEAVIRACADRDETWISEEIIQLYVDVHEMGYAHSVECWIDNSLVGGLYGVSVGGAFFGESMYHTVSDASKVALVHLVSAMKGLGLVLLDTQFTTDHLKQFGVIEIARDEYETLLADAISLPVRFSATAALRHAENLWNAAKR